MIDATARTEEAIAADVVEAVREVELEVVHVALRHRHVTNHVVIIEVSVAAHEAVPMDLMVIIITWLTDQRL